MDERRLERRLELAVRQRGGLALKFVSPGWAGAPDRIVLMPGGRIWFVELKAPGRKPRPLQAHRLRTLRDLGFRARAVANDEGLERFLSEVDMVDF